MSSFRIRPRFRKSCKMPIRDLEKKFVEVISKNEDRLVGTVSKHFIILKISDEESHFWSPRLTLMLEEKSKDSTLIRGLYGPNPNVWSFFAYSYGAIAISIFFLLIFGFSLWTLGEGAELLWWNIPLISLALILYLVAQFGQKIGAEQMYRLHHFFENVMKEHIHID